MKDSSQNEMNADVASLQVEMLSTDDLDFINEHGTRAYAEVLRDKIVDEIRCEILKRMGLDKACLPGLSDLELQTIEGLVSVEIDTRLQSVSEMENEPSYRNRVQLKALMLSQGKYGYFEDLSADKLQQAS